MFRLLADWAFDINVPLDKDPLPRILDLGCGFGDLLLYWTTRGIDTLGIDLDERAVDAAQKLGLQVVRGKLEEQYFEAESFDVMVLNHSLEHLPSPLKTLKEAARIIRPGGTIYITVPNGACAGFEIERDSWQALCFPVHFWLFDVVTLSKSLTAAGFTDIKIKTKNMWHHRLKSLKSGCQGETAAKIWQVFYKNIKLDHRGDLICASAIRN
jgi:SAM-dependent methyltransferase